MRCDVRAGPGSLARFLFYPRRFPGRNFAEIKIKNGGARGRRLLVVRPAYFRATLRARAPARGGVHDDAVITGRPAWQPVACCIC